VALSSAQFTSGKTERDYIIAHAKSLGVDPEAALAVAAHEGVSLPAEIGDQGTSFGPWQLHAGGALPAAVWQHGPAYSQQWANSPAGIDYALRQMASLVGGRTGPSVVSDIVYRFERPASPAPEAQASMLTYAQGGGPRLTDAKGNPIQTVGFWSGALHGLENPQNLLPGGGPAAHAINQATSGLFGIPGDIENLFIRGFKILGGLLLIGIGLYFIVRALAPGVAQAAQAAVVTAVPVARVVPGLAARTEAASISEAQQAGERSARRQHARRQARLAQAERLNQPATES
jgi:hypothetical protein